MRQHHSRAPKAISCEAIDGLAFDAIHLGPNSAELGQGRLPAFGRRPVLFFEAKDPDAASLSPAKKGGCRRRGKLRRLVSTGAL